MLDQWLFLALLLPLGFLLPAIPIILSRLIGPRKSNPMKDSAYECGVETVGDTWVQFKVQYYIFALVFVVFDVEAGFLFPWAGAPEWPRALQAFVPAGAVAAAVLLLPFFLSGVERKILARLQDRLGPNRVG